MTVAACGSSVAAAAAMARIAIPEMLKHGYDKGLAAGVVASAGTLAGWDSLAMVTLVALVETEFGLKLDPLDMAECDSFAAFRSHLKDQGVLL